MFGLSDFRNIPDDGWRRLTRDLSPPAGLADRPFCLRRLAASQGRFNARTQGQAYHYPGMRIMASSPPRLFVCSVAALPIPPFSKMGSWPATVHTAQRISNVSGRPIQLPGCRQPAQSHRFGWVCAEWRRKETCLKLRQIFCRNIPQFEVHFRALPGPACWVLAGPGNLVGSAFPLAPQVGGS